METAPLSLIQCWVIDSFLHRLERSQMTSSLHFYQFPVSSGKEVRVEGVWESILYLQVKCLPQSSPGILFSQLAGGCSLSLAHLPQDKF